MSFSNATPYAAIDVPMPDPRGREVVIAIVKATFDVLDDGRIVPAERPANIRVNDECWQKDDAASSLKFPSDVCIEKGGTDVIVVGDAVSRERVKEMDVAVKVRGVTVPLRVHGERVFYQGALGVAIGPAAPFTRKPIVYEKAYGGMSDDMMIVETRNPSGVGVAKNKADLVGRPAPQIEHPARPHTRASDNHPPVGFGAIMPHWSPRLERAGTFDEVWRDARLPLMPLDYDVRFNNVAHPSLIFEAPLLPGDEVMVHGMSDRGRFALSIPDLRVVVRARFDQSGKVSVRPPIDTLLIRPSDRQFEVVLRKAFFQGRGKDVLREIRVQLHD
jgi:hypothetical protein